jgi:hypothetical protein
MIGIVWPTIIIRLCQFHIIQALSRWGKSKPPNKKGKKNPHHKLNDEALQELLVIFRQTQRCRTYREWPKFKATFNNVIDAISAKYDCNANAIKTYFDANWWSEEWLGMSQIFHSGSKYLLIYFSLKSPPLILDYQRIKLETMAGTPIMLLNLLSECLILYSYTYCKIKGIF